MDAEVQIMKRKTAKEILAASFRELAAVKNIDKITIQDIVDNCGYSPATFYRHFRDKYDLIAWDYTLRIARIMEQIDGISYTWKQGLLDAALEFWSQKDYLANLFQHTSGHDSFVQYMTDINYNALKDYILSVVGKSGLDSQQEMYIRVYCLGTVCLTCEWLLGKYKCSPEEIAVIYENSLPEPLKRFLL